MIDPNHETLISLTQAAKALPARRGGKKPHVSCLYRWTTAGCRGVILESIQVGGTRCTSKEALARFFERLTNPAAPVPAASTTRTRSVTAAERKLAEAGI